MNKLLCKLAVGAALGAVLVGIGVWAGYQAAATVYEPKIATLKQQLKEAKDSAAAFAKSYDDMATAAQRQNAAIAKITIDAKEREQRAAAAIQQAKADAMHHQIRASAILASKPPAGVNECTAAREAFDLELRSERGG